MKTNKIIAYRAATGEALCAMSESVLQAQIIEPLMRLMGFTNVRDESGPNERGKDLVACKMELGRHKLYALQIKKLRISGKIASKKSMVSVLNQLRQTMTEKVRDPINNEFRPPDRGVFITPYEIPKNAMESAIEQIRELERREVTIIDGSVLVDLVLKHMPEALEQLDDELSYRMRLAKDADRILESSAFGLREDLSLDSIYVDLSVMFGGLSSLKSMKELKKGDLRKPVWISHDELATLNNLTEKWAGQQLKKWSPSKGENSLADDDVTEEEMKRGGLKQIEVDIWPVFRAIRDVVLGFVTSFRKARLTGLNETALNHMIAEGAKTSASVSELLSLGVIRRHWPKLTRRSRAEESKPQKGLSLPAISLALVDHPLLITGAPGSGKTTLLRRLAQEISRMAGSVLPILVPLIRIDQPSEQRILEVCRDTLEAYGYKLTRKDFLAGLDSGKFRLLFDGLDETGSMAPRMFVAIKSISYHYPNCAVFVTCRDAFALGEWPGAFHLTMNPFTNLQLETFIAHWFKAEPSEQAALRDWFTRNAKMKEAARVPVIAALLCSLKHADADMPSTEVELYESRCQLLLGTWERAKGIPFLSVRLRKLYMHFLMALALDMHLREEKSISYDKAVSIGQAHYGEGYMISGGTLVLDCIHRGLLLFDQTGSIHFGHLTYQEFLVGRWLASQNPVTLIWEKLISPWWDKSLAFYASIQGDITQLVIEVVNKPGISKRQSAIGRLVQMAPLTDTNFVKQLRSRK